MLCWLLLSGLGRRTEDITSGWLAPPASLLYSDSLFCKRSYSATFSFFVQGGVVPFRYTPALVTMGDDGDDVLTPLFSSSPPSPSSPLQRQGDVAASLGAHV